MASGKSEEELMEEIAERIAKNQISFDSKEEEEKRNLAKQIQIVAESQLTEIKKSFNNLIGNMTEQVSPAIRLMVLEGIFDKVNTQGLKSLDSVFSSPEILKYAEVIIKEEKNRNKEFNDENSIIRDAAYIELLKENSQIEVTETKNNIYSGQESIRNVFNNMDRKSMDVLIEKANSGDKNSQAVVTAIMSVASFTKIDKKIEDLEDFQKADLLFGMEFLRVAAEEFESKEALDFLMEIGEKTGIQIVEFDQAGNKIINREKLESVFKENNIEYIKQSKESLLSISNSYGELNGYDDMVIESTIEYTRREMYHGFTELCKKFRDKEISEEDFTRGMKEILDTDMDAAIRVVDDMSQRLGDTNTPTRGIQNSILHVYNKFHEAQKGELDFEIDKYMWKYMHNSMASVCKNMVGNENKDLIETMLRIDPLKTKEFYDARLQSEKEDKREDDEPKKGLSDEEKIETLTKSLIKMREKIGTSATVQFAISSIDRNQDKENVRNHFMNASLNMLQGRDVSYEEEERKSRKKLFEKLIHEKIYDEDALKKMIEIDSTTVKDVLDELLEMQNSRQDDKLDTIMDLSSKMKEASEKKVITVENVEIKDIIETVVGNNEEEPDR